MHYKKWIFIHVLPFICIIFMMYLSQDVSWTHCSVSGTLSMRDAKARSWRTVSGFTWKGVDSIGVFHIYIISLMCNPYVCTLLVDWLERRVGLPVSQKELHLQSSLWSTFYSLSKPNSFLIQIIGLFLQH